jgi:NAD(P)-dependent dehydrogenase (short-subunit alcohol dehydrogenase family)
VPPAGRVANKVALVTGAASGIGRATALLLAREGAAVVATDLPTADCHSLVDEIVASGGTGECAGLDVTRESDWERAIDRAVQAFGSLDILVSNAGISFAAPVTNMTLDEWRRVMAVNLDGAFLGTKHAVRVMRAGRGGSIVIVSSASGIKASAGASAYCASKAALRLFAKSVALECRDAGDAIRVNTVHPAGVVTPMWKAMEFWSGLVASHGGEEGAWKALGGGDPEQPLKRFARADEVAAAILFLASDDASMITGTELVVDGGYTA